VTFAVRVALPADYAKADLLVAVEDGQVLGTVSETRADRGRLAGGGVQVLQKVVGRELDLFVPPF
jgi:hypothetical protein